MKYSDHKRIIKAIDECDEVLMNNPFICGASNAVKACVEGAIIERRNNLFQQLKAAGVSIDEVV